MKTLEEHLQFANDCYTFAIRFVWEWQKRHPEMNRSELMRLTLLHYLLRKGPIEPPPTEPHPLEVEAAELAERVNSPEEMEVLRPKILAQVKEVYPATFAPQGNYPPGMSLRFDNPHYEFPGRWCYIHIYNALAPASMLADQEYMIRNFRYVMDEGEKEFGYDTLYTFTWLNSNPAWLRYFPQEWQEHLGYPFPGLVGNLSVLGQFLNAAGDLNHRNAEYLLTHGEPRFKRRASYCSFAAMREHLKKLETEK